MSWTLIESDADLAAALATLPREGAIAVDTEFMRRNTYYPQVALLQLYWGDRVYLLDPLAIDDVSAIAALMTDPRYLKVLHSCSEDLEVFSRWLGVLPDPLVDTQRAAALLGEDAGLGYRALVQKLLQIELDKGETRSDWLRRPLSQAQCHYAALDVLHLLPAWEILAERGDKAGRMPWILEEGREAQRAMEDREQEPLRRLKGAGKLGARELAALLGLITWREERARETDKPRGWIIDDKACLAIARAMPRDLSALADIDCLPPAVLRRQGDRLLAIVAQAREQSVESLPATFPAPLNPEQRGAVKSLREQARERARELEVAPEFLLTAADLELLVRERSGETIAAPRRWSGWRGDAVIRPLRESAA